MRLNPSSKSEIADLRALDQLDPYSTVDRVKDETGSAAGGVMLLTVLADCFKSLEQGLFHYLTSTLNLQAQPELAQTTDYVKNNQGNRFNH